MVHIKKYKGYEIGFDTTKNNFFAKDSEGKMFDTQCSNLDSLVSFIDKALDDIEKYKRQQAEKEQAEKEKQQKLKELKKEIKEISKLKYQVNIKEFKKMLKAVNEFNSEVWLMFGKDNLSILTMDTANVLMMYKQISYTDKNKHIESKVCININNIYSFIKKSNKNPKDNIDISFSIDENKNKYIHLSNGFGKVKFITITNEEYNPRNNTMPELKFSLKFKINKTEFMSYLEYATQIGNTIRFNVKNKILSLISNSEGESSYEKELFKVKCDDLCTKYSIEYIKKFKYDGNELTVELSKDYPIKITDKEGNWYILAPRVDNDDNW